MSVTVRNNRVSIRYRDASGKMVRETLGLRKDWSDAKAKAVERARRADVHKGYVKPKSVTFKRLGQEWFDDTAKANAWAVRTEAAYRTSLRRLQSFDNNKVEAIRRNDIESFVKTAMKKYAAKTVNFDLSTLHAVLEYGVRREYLQANVALRSPRPRIKKRQWRILTPEEIQLVDERFDNVEAQLIYRTLVRTGLRRGEIRHLKVQDIDFIRNALRVVESKTEEGERWMSLPGSLVVQLQAWCVDKDPGQYVFPSSLGNPFNPEWYANAFNRALSRAGVTEYIRPFHDMRHTSLTLEAATGESNFIALMARAGHTDAKVTRQYTKLAGVLFPVQAEALDRLLGG